MGATPEISKSINFPFPIEGFLKKVFKRGFAPRYTFSAYGLGSGLMSPYGLFPCVIQL